MRSAFRFLLPFFRPHAGRFLLVVVFAIGVAIATVGQAYLIQPLLNKVLLRGTTDDEEETDKAWLKAARAAHPEAVRQPGPDVPEATRRAALDGLTVFSGRAAPRDAWNEDGLCLLLERTRQVLLEVARNLGEEEVEANASLLAALRLQRQAEALIRDPLGRPTPSQINAARRAQVGALSLQARTEARLANFQSAQATLSWILGVAVLLAIVLGTFRYLEATTSRIISTRIYVDMQVALVRHILGLSAGQVTGHRRGDLLSRLNTDLSQVVNGIVLPMLSTVVLQPIHLLVLFLGAVYISWQLSLGLVVLALTVLGPIRWGGRLIRTSAKDRQSALAEVLEALNQMFAGVRLVKAFQREAYEQERFKEKTDRAYQADVKVITARTASRSWLRLMNDMTIPVVVLGGGWLIVTHTGGMNAGKFAAFAGLVMLMYKPTKQLAMAYNTIQDALPSTARVREVFDQATKIEDAPDALACAGLTEQVAVEDVWFSYDGDTDVLKGISFTAPRGTTTAFVGPTGSGKSTLMDLIARHLDPTRGEVRIDGVPLRRLQLATWLARVAVVSQERFVFNDTLRENIRYGRLDATDDEIVAAAQAAQIHDEILKQPEGYDTVAGELGGKLSGGQVQRLSLARAFVRNPEVLLLDEATSALDTHTERKLQQALSEITKTCTTFVIAHRLSTVREADLILVLDQGQVVERGTHDDLLALGGRYASLVGEMPDREAPAEPAPLLHIVARDVWERARDGETYEPAGFASEGFVHLSTPAQVLLPANRLFQGRDDLLLLVLDPARLEAEVRYEDLLDEGQTFPHLYGPLPINAVERVVEFPPGPDGRFALPAELLPAPAGTEEAS